MRAGRERRSYCKVCARYVQTIISRSEICCLYLPRCCLHSQELFIINMLNCCQAPHLFSGACTKYSTSGRVVKGESSGKFARYVQTIISRSEICCLYLFAVLPAFARIHLSSQKLNCCQAPHLFSGACTKYSTSGRVVKGETSGKWLNGNR